MITTDVENYPGFAEPIQGPWLMEQMRAQAEHVGARIESEYVVGARPRASARSSSAATAAASSTADAIILATGAKAKWLGLPSEETFKGFGVSACATCDGFFFRGKPVVVVGGGNSAVEEALYLSNIASDVTVVHRRDSFRAEKILQRAAVRAPQREGALEQRGRGDSRREAAARRHRRRGCATSGPARSTTSRPTACSSRSATRRRPNSCAASSTLKPNGYVQTAPGSTATSVEGVFAAGDVADDVFRQAVTAAGLGCMAALEAERWLAAQRSARAMKRRNSRTRTIARAPTCGRSALAGAASGGTVMDWDKLRIFQAAADAGSFTHAGETLGLSQSAVSRQVGALEADLGAPLFHRHARGLILTEQGEMLLGAVHDVVLKLDAVRSRLIDSREKPTRRAAGHDHARRSAPTGSRRGSASSSSSIRK